MCIFAPWNVYSIFINPLKVKVMKKVFLLIGAAVAMSFMACTGSSTTTTPEGEGDSTEVAAPEPEAEPEPAEPAPVVGPATYENDAFTIEVAEGWQVTKQSSSRCTIEPVEKPEKGSNFGWKMDVTIWDGKVFTAEDAIKTEQDVFEESKSQPNQKLGDFTYLYTYMPYEFGDHSVLAAPLSDEGGRIEVGIGGYKLEDTPALQEMLKSLKLK